MGFVEFLFKTKKGKKVMGLLYGLGASVVIVGALFKIQHWPGAGPMLIVGLLTEAIIFAVSAFEPPHMDTDWSLVYPELAGLHDDEEDSAKEIESGYADKSTVTEQLDAMLEEAKIEPELIENLGSSMRNLSDNASKLGDISSATVATENYATALNDATSKVGQLKDTYEQASQALTGISAASEAGSSTGEHLAKMADNLRALNESYEAQIQGSRQHLETTNQMYAGIAELIGDLNKSVEDTKAYKENIAELSNNLSKLNTIYGNMLSAMNAGGGAANV